MAVLNDTELMRKNAAAMKNSEEYIYACKKPTALDIWHTKDKIPELYCGDKIVGIVCERYHTEYSKDGRTKKVIRKKFPFMVILEATEDGWRCDDEVFDGYGPHDCELWAYERDFAKIVDSLIPNFDWS